MGQETEQGRGERYGEHHETRLPLDREEYGHVSGRNRRHAGSHPIHVVEQVQGICDADEPEERDRPVDPVDPGQLEPDATEQHDQRGDELAAEFGERRQIDKVVDEPQQEGQRRRHHEPLPRRPWDEGSRALRGEALQQFGI